MDVVKVILLFLLLPPKSNSHHHKTTATQDQLDPSCPVLRGLRRDRGTFLLSSSGSRAREFNLRFTNGRVH